MKKKVTKVFAMIGACVLAMGGLTACGSTEDISEAGKANIESSVEDTKLSGKIQMVGSTSMEKFANALAESFMEKYPDIMVGAEFVGSSAGVEAVIGGTADVGNSSRNLKAAEKEAGAVENVVAIEGIAVCLDPANTVTDLSKQQLIDIYTGVVTNWKELGGADAPIIVVGREASSGTRGAFEELLEIEEMCVYANELDSTGAVIAKVAPTAENVKGGRYFRCRPFVMATLGEISEQSELVQAWFAFVLGAEGQTVAEAVGLISVE